MLGAVLKGTANAIGGGARRIATDKLMNRKKNTDARRAAAQKMMGGEEGGEEKGGAIVVKPKAALVHSPAGAIQKYTGADQQQSGGGEDLQGLVLHIKTSVISVEKLLGNSVALQKQQIDDARKAREAAQHEKTEEELEKKKPKVASKGPKLNLPGKGLLSSIMDFVINIAFGWIAVRLLKFAPQIAKILPAIGAVADFIINWGGKILNALATMIDWGYKLVELGRGAVKGVFGEEGAEKFDTFMGNIKDLIQGFLIWKIIGQKIFKAIVGNIKNAFNVIKGIFAKAGKVLNWMTGGRAGNLAKNILSKGANLAKNVGGKLLNFGKNLIGGGGQKALGGAAKGAKSIMKKGVGKAAKRAVIKMFGKTAGKIFGKIPIIGPVIVGIVSLLSGEPIGQAIFKTMGAAVGGLLGTFIPIPVVGTLLGEAIGVFVGDLLYHLIVKRDPKAAFKMLKDTIMGIFKGGKAIFNWFAGGFSRFYQGIPKLKIPDFPKDPPKWIPGWVPRKKALWNILTGGIKLVIGPLSLLMGKEIPILPWLINPANTVPLLIKSFFPPGGSDSGGGSLSMGGSSSGMSSGSGGGDEESKKEEAKKKKEEEKKKKREEMKAKISEVKSKVGGFFGKIGKGIKSAVGSEINKRKEKAEVMRAKAAKVKESVGGFFSRVGKGIKNVGGAIISKHPAVMAAKAIKGKISSSSTPKSTNSSPPTINKPNNSFSNMINSVSKKAEYEELEPVIVTVPVLVKTGGGVINQPSSTTVASTGGGSGNDPFEVLDFQG